MSTIPLSIPHLAGSEWEYVKECLDTGWVSSAGAFVRRLEESLAAYTGSAYAIATVNGTSALHLGLQLLGVKPGDYVLLPDLTFVASCNAIRYLGADPILLDVSPESWQLDLDLLEEFLMNYTHLNERDELVLKRDGRVIRALLPVHLLGSIGDMERLLFIGQRFHLPILEDAAEALGTQWKGQAAGTFGKIGTLSFNGNKIITTGGGGMILTADEALAQQARHLSTQAKVSPDEYDHDEVGYNYRLVNVLAAIGLAQMEQLDGFLAQRRRIDRTYREQLGDLPDIRFQETGAHAQPNGWLFTLRTPRKEALLAHLRKHGIGTRPIWKPMHTLPMYAKSLYIRQEDHAQAIYDQGVSLPSSSSLKPEEQAYVIERIRELHNA